MSRIIYAILTCLLPFYAVSQAPSINFRHIKSENGLSNSTIETIFQDNRGFMWFGTRDGLNRYDGSQIIIYRYSSTDTSTISDNFITSLYQDKQNNLWVGTLNGLNQFDPKLNRFTRLKHNPADRKSISSNHITAIYGDTKGHTWLGTWGGGSSVYLGEKDGFKRVDCSRSGSSKVPELNIYAFYEDKRGNLWAGTEGGLYLYDVGTDQFSAVSLQPSVNKQAVRSITEDKNGALLLGMADNGLAVFNPSFSTFQQYMHTASDATSISSNLVRTVYAGRKGEIWVGTVNGGLDRFDIASGKFYNYHYQPDNPNSLSQRTVSVLYEDKQGNLWIGTHRGGINLYMPGAEKFNLYREKPFSNSLSYNDVKSFCEDKYGNIWIGTDGGGLNLFNRQFNTFAHYMHDPFNQSSLGSNEVVDIKEDSDGNLWIATWGGGLCLYNRSMNNFIRYRTNTTTNGHITSDYIQCIFEDKNLQTWIGTYYGGLYLLDKKNKTFIPVTKSKSGKTTLAGNNILSLTQDKEGNLWIGTDDGGLNKLAASNGEFEHYFYLEDKKPDIRVLFTDSKGNVWIGQAGLYRYDKAANDFSVFTNGEGLSAVFIKGIVEDNNGYLWISTSAGLKQLDPTTKTVRTYNTGDGLQAMEFEANAYLKTKDGQVYFGGVNGFNSFYPNQIKLNAFIPPVYVTDFQVRNIKVVGGNTNKLLAQDISFTDKIILSYKDATFSFGFAALNFTASENNRFAYKLENWDKDWIIAGSENKASYTNVSPGTYTFTTKASNNDGVWNEKGQSIEVIITPPFQNTWWFRLMAAAMLLMVAFYIYRIRKKVRLQRYEEEKKEEIHQVQLQFFTNISHEFRTPLSLITGPIEKLLKDDAGSKNNHMYQVIQRNASRLLQLINELMDFRKAESGVLKLQVMPGSIPLFINEIAEELSELALQKNISFTVSGNTSFHEVWFDRQVLEKIILNLLSNSFKYTQDCGQVTLQVMDSLETFQPLFENELVIKHNDVSGQFIYFRIADNGTGISKESMPHLFERYYRVTDIHLGSGIGLAFVKTLTQLHKGNIYVYSGYNKGTEIVIAIPVNKTDYKKKEQWMKNNESPVRLESLVVQTLVRPSGDTTTMISASKEASNPKEWVVLIADDNAELRSFLKESLEQQYKIIEAADGKEAMEKSMEFFPDLIISDIMMPVMNGIDYCRLIKTTIETAHIPFILLTAKDGLESRIEGTETGADYYFSKPLSIDLLQLTMRNILVQKEKLKEHYRKDQHAEIKELAHSTRDKQFMEDLLAIIENNLSKPEMDIDFVCAEIGMSRTKLYNKIRSISGQPIGDFIRTIRLRKAAVLMTQGEGSLVDIMYSVGIQTQSYFSKAFKQEFGKTPTQYIKDFEGKK
ncbi:MAG: two-component regulator propeller domain-containing protein [Ferruginibacter sp.]